MYKKTQFYNKKKTAYSLREENESNMESTSNLIGEIWVEGSSSPMSEKWQM